MTLMPMGRKRTPATEEVYQTIMPFNHPKDNLGIRDRRIPARLEGSREMT